MDRILMHPFFGLIAFFLIMSGIFTAIYSLATTPMDWIDGGFGWLIDFTKANMSESWFRELLADGIIAGIGSVVIFLPQIVILFLCIGYLEDSGYLARAAMLIDRPLAAIGLNGRSFVPLLSGFACAIPAMMAARTIRNRAERLVTIFIIPLMSCSARLPVYIILVSFLTPKNKPWVGGLTMAGLYFFSILLGVVIASVISRFSVFRRSGHSPFQLEIPALKKPLAKVILRSTYERSMNYLRKAGPVIVLIGIALWFLTNYPKSEAGDYAATANSYAAQVGKVTEPVMRPMGLDWRGGVSLMMGFAAREVFVQSLALMYRVEIDPDAEDEESAMQEKLLERMQTVTFEGSEQKIFTLSSCLGLIFFFTMALQCFPTVAVAKSETDSWKIALFQLAAYTGLAYLGAVVIVQAMRACGIN
jgi:ferrous iron transport protein B